MMETALTALIWIIAGLLGITLLFFIGLTAMIGWALFSEMLRNTWEFIITYKND